MADVPTAAGPDRGRSPGPNTDRRAALTPRQRQVLALLAEQQSDQAIAAALGISRRTASNHVAAIIRKLGVETRKSAARRAVREGLV